jgi:hypothetical protein
MVKDAGSWEVEPERWASKFDAGYYGKLLEKAWQKAAFSYSAEFALCRYLFFLALVFLRIAELNILLGLERTRIQLLAFVHIERPASHVLDIPNPFECHRCIIN